MLVAARAQSSGVVVALALMLGPALAFAGPGDPPSSLRPIPPGNEERVMDMLGGRIVMPGGCRMADASILPDRIIGRYRCDSGPLEMTLRFLEDVPTAEAHTAGFALLASRPPPDKFLDTLAERVRAREAEFGAPRAQPSLALPRLLLAGVALAIVGLASAKARWRDVAIACAITLVAALARLGFGVWGPLHVNGQGPMWLAEAIAHHGLLYGPGYAEMLGAVAQTFPALPDTAIFAAIALASSLTPALTWSLARSARLGVASALVAAGLVALDPIAMRASATESYLPLIGALTLAGAAGYAGAATSWSRGRRFAAVALALSASCLVAQAVRIHPVAWIPSALAPLAGLLDASAARPPRRIVVVVCLGLVAAVVVALTSGSVVAAVLAGIHDGSVYRPRVPSLVEIGLVPVAMLVVWSAAFARRRPALGVLAAPYVLGAFVTWRTYAQSAMWQHAALRVFLPMLIVVVVASLPRRGLLVATALAGLWLGSSFPIALRRTTEQREYTWLRAQLRSLPDRCALTWVRTAERRVLTLPVFPPHDAYPIEGRSGEGLPTGDGEPCLYYVRGSLCASAEGRPVCDAVERRLELAAPLTETFPAVPSYDGLPYDGPVVESRLARITRIHPPDP